MWPGAKTLWLPPNCTGAGVTSYLRLCAAIPYATDSPMARAAPPVEMVATTGRREVYLDEFQQCTTVFGAAVNNPMSPSAKNGP